MTSTMLITLCSHMTTYCSYGSVQVRVRVPVFDVNHPAALAQGKDVPIETTATPGAASPR
ncbi:hypothetical protein GCM10010176_071420 [Nonomuraea spiralis]|nr:hypothetical protein GCM10010176_071420 [Nonomuraea spiralis]